MLAADPEKISAGQENHHLGTPTQKSPSKLLMLLKKSNMGKILL